MSSRLRPTFLLVALLGAAALAGCGSGADSSDDDSGDTTGSAAAADDAAFPVTIKHALGEATIEEAPERVVTWGPSNQDSVLALGVTPVAMPFFDYGGDDEGVLPWVREALGDADLPELLPNAAGEEIPYEAIAEAQPDVILAVYSGLTQEEYDTLSAIAPTVAYPDAPWSTPWQEQTRVIGQALGRSAEAEQLVTATEEYLATRTDEYPELAGATFAYGAEDGAQLALYTSDDVRVRLLTDLGMTLAPYVDEHAEGDGVYYYVSPELAGDIESDVFVAWFNDQAAADVFAANPAYAQIPAVAAGAFAPIAGEDYVTASSAPSVLSIPWMLDEYLPQLADAVTASGASATGE
ncbi:iron-siderophore ABC transporter substrate-binding protein [Jiangella aurantiaca]|uniref:Iron-siderophore ABC transporter substrate-binding protein n=1 Tax=Jiangella aurantiaca TaxID=2530373 RepID=A0A4R5A457_9ACTN|nr:iron-siderophore ABC transporter substrate-binding protein [Jiangella aurantiaca]TDD66295.1 iron-siderophore ABC transporter substrate-binding protein [Jiangella aurantiaca]